MNKKIGSTMCVIDVFKNEEHSAGKLLTPGESSQVFVPIIALLIGPYTKNTTSIDHHFDWLIIDGLSIFLINLLVFVVDVYVQV